MKRRFFKKKPIVSVLQKFQIKPDYKEKVRLQSYLGKKGYTIPKVVLEAEDLVQIKEVLLLKPFVPGPQYGAPTEETASLTQLPGSKPPPPPPKGVRFSSQVQPECLLLNILAC